jgi:hypothetical protein
MAYAEDIATGKQNRQQNNASAQKKADEAAKIMVGTQGKEKDERAEERARMCI